VLVVVEDRCCNCNNAVLSMAMVMKDIVAHEGLSVETISVYLLQI
jgi:hypothetical protein